MISISGNEVPSEPYDGGIVWYWSYTILFGLGLILSYIILDLHLYLNASFNPDLILYSSLFWIPIIIITILVTVPLRIGLSEEGVHVVLSFRRKIVRWEDIKFIDRSIVGLPNNYGVIAVFDAQNKVHSTGIFSSKVLEDMNCELRKHRAAST